MSSEGYCFSELKNENSFEMLTLHRNMLETIIKRLLCAKRALKVSKWHNFVTIQDTDMYVTSISTAGTVF